MLYIETAQLPISHVISVRRMLYWHTLISRSTEELTRQVYSAMKEQPIKGDWIFLLKEDLERVGLGLEDEKSISKICKHTFKKYLKIKIRELSIIELEGLKSEHEKVKYIAHTNLEKPQDYLTNNLFSNAQKSILFNLRSSFRDDFHKMYTNYMCQLCNIKIDS